MRRDRIDRLAGEGREFGKRRAKWFLIALPVVFVGFLGFLTLMYLILTGC